MGLLDRVKSTLNQTASAAKARVGLVSDIATAGIGADDFGDMIGNIGHAVTKRGKEAAGGSNPGLLGAIGAATATPSPGASLAQSPAGQAFNAVNSGLNRLYTDAVSHPGSSLFLNAAQAQQDAKDAGNDSAWQEAKRFFRKSAWTDSWDKSQGVSIGQAYALSSAVDTNKVNINDDADLQRFVGSDYFGHISGAADVFSRTFLDPTVVGGKALTAARGLNVVREGVLVEKATGEAVDASKAAGLGADAVKVKGVGLPSVQTKIVNDTPRGGIAQVVNRVAGADRLTPQQQINSLVNSKEFLKANISMENKSGAYIAQRYFANEKDGGLIGDLYEQAGTIENRQNLTRYLMGDQSAYNELENQSSALTNQIDRLYGEQAMVGDKAKFYNTVEQQQRLSQEIDELHPQADNINLKSNVWAALNQVPTNTLAGAARTNLTRSNFYQSSALATPLRVINRKAPTGILDVSNDKSGSSYTQVQRQLERSNLGQAERDDWLSQYVNAPSPEQRQHVYEQAEQAGIKSIIQRHTTDAFGNTVKNMSDEEVDALITKAGYHDGRGGATEALSERAYDGDPNRSMVKRWDEDGYEMVHTPLFEGQNQRLIPMVNFDELRKADRIRPEGLTTAAEMGNELLTSYNKVWKASTLIRLGYPVRVQADQQMRIIAKLGALSQAGNILDVGKYAAVGISRAVRNQFQTGELGIGSTVRINGGELGKVISRNSEDGIRVATKTGEVVDTHMDNIRFAQARDYGIGQKDLKIGNYMLPGAFSQKRDDLDVIKAGISGADNVDALAGKAEKGIFDRMHSPDEVDDVILPNGQKLMGSHRTISPTNPADTASYPLAWEHSVNHIIGQSQLGRKLLAGEEPEAVKAWLKNTKEGRDLRKRMSPLRSSDADQWVDVAHDSIESITNGDPALKALALEGKASFKDLQRAIPDATMRPTVSGQQLVQAVARDKSSIVAAANSFTSKAFKLLGTLPDDILARQPLYKSLYENEAKRLVGLLDEGTPVDSKIIGQVQKTARSRAQRSTQDLMFDMANQTDLARMLKFVSPFYMAWQDSFTRWTANAIEHPDTLAQVRNLWHSPERAGMVRDENGNIVNDDGTATDPMTGEKVARGKSKYVVIMKPNWMKIPGVEDGSNLAFNKQTFNLLLSGSPGVGPLAAVPLNAWVTKHPDQESLFKWALPYGAQSTASLLEPSLVRRVDTALNEDADTTQKLALRIYQTKMTDYRASLGGPHEMPEPTFADAQEQAKQQSYVKVVAGLVLPFVPTFQSPYQMYIDAYRRGQAATRENPAALGTHVNGDPVSADEWFTDTYGDEMFYLTQSLTKSHDGVNPTTGGYQKRKEYEDLVESHPELGGFITGEDGAGSASKAAYNSSFYRSQTQNRVSPGSEFNQRETLSGDEFNNSAQSSEGWRQYTKNMDMIDAELHDRGLDNINVKGARDIKAVKQAMVADLAQKYPGWYEDFNQTDRGAFQKKIDGFTAVTENKSQMNRKEVQGVKQYLDARKSVLAELKSRSERGGSASITAKGNTDIARMWDNLTISLTENNVSFAQTYHRYLENDPLEQN